MTMRGSIINNWAKCGARALGGLIGLTPLALSLLAGGCSSTTTATTNDTCSQNTNLACGDNIGYSCTGAATPGPDLICGAGTITGDYCCYAASTTADSCSKDITVDCSSGGSGYTCTSSTVQPEQFFDVLCGGPSGNSYCCNPVTASTCQPDPAVTDCAAGTWGYSCASGDPSPDATTSTLVCSIPTKVGFVDEYCCFDNTITPPADATCQKDWTLACEPDSAGNPSYGFTCTGTDTPDQDFSNITNCSAATGDGTFCCTY